MNTVEALKGDISKWEATSADVETQLQAARQAADAAKAERERVLLAARAEGDADAKRELTKATRALDTATREVDDCETLARQVDERLAELRDESRKAFVREAGNEIEKLMPELADVDGRIEALTAELCENIQRNIAIRRTMASIANRAGLPGVNIFQRLYTLRAFLGMKLRAAGANVDVPLVREYRQPDWPGLRAENERVLRRVVSQFPTHNGNGAA